MRIDGAQEGSNGGSRAESSPEAARGERGREESPPAPHVPQRRVQPERLTSHSSMFLNKLGLSSETRLEVYRVLIQTRKVLGVQLHALWRLTHTDPHCDVGCTTALHSEWVSNQGQTQSPEGATRHTRHTQ